MPPPKKLKIALCQISVTEDKKKNIETALANIKEAAASGASLVVLPEMWNCPYSNDSFPSYAEDIDGGTSESIAMLSSAARDANIVLVGGSIPERSEGRLYNTSCVFGRDGHLLAKHRKIHLFDIDIPGKITFKESLTLSPGESLTVVDTDIGRLGVGICYDMRFPEMSQLYAAKGCQILVFPGAFNLTTGPAHWELLLRARAIDNQVFVAACSPARSSNANQYQAWGHSTVVDPWATVRATCDHTPQIVYADLDLAEIEERRTGLPYRQQKRLDLYALVDLKTLE
nr:omega-amidase (OA) [Polytomella parva]|eukprot:CAMPEP_0175058578 /NCGR_PEP_ID=MMETSP0052_2-20121109/11929_1 /TAXON_ID=51329 ORGANISM="Polytomella parva, Strain SAG 63-3" /NCGR_SAMPLE_ID=MMETSP0052_2 /ASSEMBLY_ACC=CAM_ASM_000194 /LENGTH=285 /DNA_ID=CAMNT_0016323981 /DNA_START=303 /DNA_END=1160 /DNA_ORIENTATION=-